MPKTYKTIQVDAAIHELFKKYCAERNVSLGTFTEGLFLCALSGSISGSKTARTAFHSEHAALYGNQE